MKTITASLIALLLAGLCIGANPQKGEPSNIQDGNAPNAQCCLDRPISVNVVPAKPTAEETAEAKRASKEKSDTDRKLADFTGKLANYTFWLAIATVLLVGATIGLGWLAWRQGNDTQKSIDIADKTLVATNRPWVDLEVEPIRDLVFVNGAAQMAFRITAINVGDSPAINCDINAGMVAFPKTDPPEVGQEVGFQVMEGKLLYRTCRKIRTNEMRKHAASNPDVLGPLGFALFPKSRAHEVYNLGVSAEDIEKAKSEMSGIFWLVVVASVDYQFPFSDEGGITGKAFTILKIDLTANGGKMQFTEAAGTFPLDALAIDVAIRNGVYAA